VDAQATEGIDYAKLRRETIIDVFKQQIATLAQAVAEANADLVVFRTVAIENTKQMEACFVREKALKERITELEKADADKLKATDEAPQA